MISIVIPIRTVTEGNAKEHWRTKAKRAKGQRSRASFIVAHEIRTKRLNPGGPIWQVFVETWGPLVVTLTRVSPGTLDDDNLVGSQKHVRDGVADALGIDDRDPRVTWRYAQRRGKPKEYAVEIRIERREETAA